MAAAVAHAREMAALRRFNLVTAVDCIGLVVTIVELVKLLQHPLHPLALPGVCTAVSAWIVLHVVADCGCGGRWWPAPALIAILLTLTTNHLGAFYHYIWPWYTPQAASMQMIWVFDASYLAFAAGTWLYARATRLSTAKLVEVYFAKPLTLPRGHAVLLVPCLLIFALGVAATIYMLGGRPPLFDVLMLLARGQFIAASAAALQARIGVYKAEYRFQGYLDQFRSSVLPMLALLWYASGRISGLKYYRVLGVVGPVVAGFLLFAQLQRGGLLFFIIQLAMVTMLIYRPRPSLRWVWALGGAFMTIVLLSLVLGRGAVSGGFLANVLAQIQHTAYRIYAPNSMGSVEVFNMFPAHMPFRGGMTWVNDLGNLLPGKGSSFSQEIYASLYGGLGTSPPHLVAEMWANGGWLAVILLSAVVGAFMQWVNLRGLAMPERTPLRLVVTALIFYCTSLLGAAGLITVVERGLLAFLLLGWFLDTLLRLSPAQGVAATRRALGSAPPSAT
jgi:hypothetical protein